MVAVVAAALLGVSVSSALMTIGPVPKAAASPAPLTVSVDRSLSLVNQAITLTIDGRISGSLDGATLVVLVMGPAALSQVGQTAPELPEAAVTTTETEALRLWTGADLAAGVLSARVSIPPGTPAEPGAYLLVVEVRSSGIVVAGGHMWVGKAAPREAPLDLAFVWPVSLGIHRDAGGVFFDRVLEEAVSPTADGAGDLRGLLALSGRFSDWDFTLALEPVLLTQLRDMADGYVRLDASGGEADVAPDDPSALHAAEVLAAFKGLNSDDSVEIAVSPYAGADLGVLAAEGWRDGLQQIQMGKQEVQQTLALSAPPRGAYSPDLDLTTDSLTYYAGASIDHVVVGAALTELLTEPIADGTVAVRARDSGNDRVTLIFANSGLSARMTAPWDAGVFSAALAAELAAGTRDAIVVTPRSEFTLVPGSYLEAIGEILRGTRWVRTQTLTALLRAHTPDTRPILLKTVAGGAQGYIEESLLAGIRAAHSAVTDLAAIADATRAPVEEAHRLLYIAESRWWSRPETSPREASVGLSYAEKARQVAQDELAKVRLLGAGSTVIVGSEGTVSLGVQNDAGYPFTVVLDLAGSGVMLPEGGSLEVEIAPGRTDIPVQVVKSEGSPTLDVVLMAGGSALDEAAHSLRFITIMTVLPWTIIALVIVGIGAYILVHRWVRKRRAAQPARSSMGT